jgi:hypothetical protein
MFGRAGSYASGQAFTDGFARAVSACAFLALTRASPASHFPVATSQALPAPSKPATCASVTSKPARRQRAASAGCLAWIVEPYYLPLSADRSPPVLPVPRMWDSAAPAVPSDMACPR